MVSLYDQSIKNNADFITIQKFDYSEISGEVVLDTTQQITKPFIKKHFRTTNFPTDTNIKSGDLFRRGDQRYLQIELTDIFSQRQLLCRDGVAYKCNYSGEIRRLAQVKTELGNNETDTELQKDVYGVIGAFSDFLNDEPPGDIETGRWGMWLPQNISGEIGDVVVLNSGEVDRFQQFRIKTLNPGVDLDGVKLLSMDLDTRR